MQVRLQKVSSIRKKRLGKQELSCGGGRKEISLPHTARPNVTKDKRFQLNAYFLNLNLKLFIDLPEDINFKIKANLRKLRVVKISSSTRMAVAVYSCVVNCDVNIVTHTANETAGNVC